MRSSKRILGIAAGLVMVLAACGDDDAESEATQPVATAAPTSAAPATTPDTEATDTSATVDTTEAPDDTTATDDTGEASDDTTDAGATTTTEFVPPARGDADLVIWADETRADVLTPLADAFAEAEGLEVSVLEVPFETIRDNLSKAGPAGEGPDIIIGAHDWLGELVSNGAVAPLDLGAAAEEYADVAIQAFTYEGSVYGLPYAVENIALIRNTELVPEAPATFEELEEIALQLKAEGTVEVPLAVQQAPADPYHNYPLFSAAGGYVFGQNEDGTYDPTDLGIDSEGGLKAAQLFKKWSDEGLISKDVSYDIMIESFGAGKAPFAITGPWAVSDPDRGFKQAGVPYSVEPIPPFADGGTPQVFVGVQGFMVSAFSENEDLAKTFLLDYVNTEEVQLELFEAGGRPPAMLSAFEQVKDDPDVQGFGLSGQQGVPQPAIPAMAKVWQTWNDAYNLIFTGTDPEQAFTEAAATIRESIG